MVGVAQSVERRSVAAEAAGSKPVTHPKFTNKKQKSFSVRIF